MFTVQVGHGTNRARDSLHPVWLHVIQSVEEVEPYLDAIVECYKLVFAGAPYFEDYTGQEETFIKPAFRNFSDRGVLALLVTGNVLTGNQLIGFGASEGADVSEAAEFLSQHADRLEADLNRYMYMAEVGVVSEFRRQGFGQRLIDARIREAVTNPKHQFSHLLMRTAKEGSNSIGLYLRLGAVPIEGLIEIKEVFGTASKERIFLTRRLVV